MDAILEDEAHQSINKIMKQLLNYRYIIEAFLGTGAMGEVYLAYDLMSDNKIVLKTLIKDTKDSIKNREAFQKEFKVMTEVHHPNICRVYDFGIVGTELNYLDDDLKIDLKTGDYFFTMEYLKGLDWDKVLNNLTELEFYETIVQVCQALDYVHTRGLVHYDIKPSNIRIIRQQKKVIAKLMDFGLASILSTNTLKGTPAYIAPEIVQKKHSDYYVDYYSFGVVLYQLFTGSLPFTETDLLALLQAQVEKQPIPPSKLSDIPSNIEHIILKLLSKNIEDRPSNLKEIILTLNETKSEVVPMLMGTRSRRT